MDHRFLRCSGLHYLPYSNLHFLSILHISLPYITDIENVFHSLSYVFHSASFHLQGFQGSEVQVFNLFFKVCHFTCKVFEKMKPTVFHTVFKVLCFTNKVFRKSKFKVFKFFKEQQLDFYCVAFNVLLEFASAIME